MKNNEELQSTLKCILNNQLCMLSSLQHNVLRFFIYFYCVWNYCTLILMGQISSIGYSESFVEYSGLVSYLLDNSSTTDCSWNALRYIYKWFVQI